MKKYFLILLCSLLLLTGCVNIPDTTTPTDPDIPPTDPQAELSEQALFDMLFDIQNKVQLRLDMSDTELQKMQNDYEKYDKNGSKSPIYRMADLHISITTPDGSCYGFTVPEVGVRMKGNTSRTDFYNTNDGIYNIIHLKLDFQETFDDADYYGEAAKQWDAAEREQRKDRTFATLEKMDLRWNRCDDSTYLKEYFAYATYRENGVPAPHTNLCSFDWAGNHMGVFTINEPIDKVFLKKYLPEEALGGDLYKCGWAENGASFTDTDSIGIENEDEGKFYTYDLKTNKKTSEHSALIGLIETLNNGTVTKESFGSLVDMNNFLPYCAVSYLMGNPDDMRNNYNNFYVYFRADNGKAMIFPYDFDRCLGVTTHWNPTSDGVTSDNPFGTTTLANGSTQKSPMILYSVAAGGYYVRPYGELLAEIAESDWFSYENFASLYRIAYENYARDAAPGKAFRNAEHLDLSFDLEKTSDFSSNGNISIREYLEAKKNTLRSYLQNIDRYENAGLQTSPVWYIRADFTGWNMDGQHILTEENGLFVYSLTTNHSCSLKIYNNQTGKWYGTERIGDGCTVPFETDGHSNIILQPGVYRILIDPETYEIFLETEN